MPSFFPSEPNNWWKTQAERDDWIRAQEEMKAQKKRETRRFVITTALSGIAALAAVVGVIVQLVLMR